MYLVDMATDLAEHVEWMLILPFLLILTVFVMKVNSPPPTYQETQLRY